MDFTSICTIYLSFTEHVNLLMETVFLDGCGLFQHDNALCHKGKAVQVEDWFEDNNNEFEVLPVRLHLATYRIKGSVANILVHTTYHSMGQGSSRVHVLMGQVCFESKRGINTILGCWS